MGKGTFGGLIGRGILGGGLIGRLIDSAALGGGLIGSGTFGGLVGGAGNEGIGGGRENAGALELPAESVRGGGLCFCILNGPTVGVSGDESAGLKNSSSSGRPCLRKSIVGSLCRYPLDELRARDDGVDYFWLRMRNNVL